LESEEDGEDGAVKADHEEARRWSGATRCGDGGRGQRKKIRGKQDDGVLHTPNDSFFL
jgi:hypothetical protein